MTTHYEDRCTVDGCPDPNSDDFHRCPVCGKQAVQHHHYPSRAQGGKGAKIVAALCQNHHDKITLHQWREGVYDHPDGSKRYYVQNLKGEEMCDVEIEAAPEGQASSPQGECYRTRGTAGADLIVLGTAEALGDDEQAPADVVTRGDVVDGLPVVRGEIAIEHVPDEQLAALFAEADKKQAEGFLLKCRIVHTFRERHVQAWGSSWIEEAYTLFHVSRRTLNAYANLHEICDTSDRYLIEQIAPLTDSRSLMTHIGRKKVEDGKVALEAAVAHQAEYGEPPTVKALMHRLGVEAKPPEVCPTRADLPHEWLRVCKWCKAVKEK